MTNRRKNHKQLVLDEKAAKTTFRADKNAKKIFLYLARQDRKQL